jgi:hypothetical protein
MDDRRLDELIRSAGAPKRPSSAFEEQLLLRVQSEFVAESQPDDERDVPRISLTVVNRDTLGEPGSSGHRGQRLLIAAAAVALIGGVAAGLVATMGSRVEQQLATAPEPEPPATTNPVLVAPSSTAPNTTSPPPATVAAVEPLPAAETLESLRGFCAETLPSVAAIAEVTYHYGDRGEDIGAAVVLLRSSLDELTAALDDIGDAGVDVADLVDDRDDLEGRLTRLEAEAAAGRTNAVRGSLPAIARDVVAIVSAVPGFDISQCSPIDSQEGSS